jgi:cyclopropane-fatty-acyl-phospholipid synthase
MLGLRNLTTLTCNINDFDLLTHGDEKRAPVDRIISIEMFEHMKNYELLLQRCARWLTPRGRLLVHIFTFAHHSYHYEVQSASDWMTKYFFAGGTMPAVDLLMRFQKHLLLINHWRVNGARNQSEWFRFSAPSANVHFISSRFSGVHYSKTLEAWLRKFDERAAQVRQVLADTYGADAVGTWFMRWRMFFMASSELFRLDGGDTFFVSHYQFENRAT